MDDLTKQQQFAQLVGKLYSATAELLRFWEAHFEDGLGGDYSSDVYPFPESLEEILSRIGNWQTECTRLAQADAAVLCAVSLDTTDLGDDFRDWTRQHGVDWESKGRTLHGWDVEYRGNRSALTEMIRLWWGANDPALERDFAAGIHPVEVVR